MCRGANGLFKVVYKIECNSESTPKGILLTTDILKIYLKIINACMLSKICIINLTKFALICV